MSKKILFVIVTVISLSFNAYAYDNGDFQIWNSDYQNVEVYKDVKLAMEQELRFGENASELYYQHYEWDAVFCFDKMLDLAFGYRMALSKYKHKWIEEDQSNVNATLKFDLWKFKLEDRNRLEYRHFRYKDDFIRYRNKLTIKFPFDFKKLKISPYVSNEILISSNSTGFNEDRFFSGIELGLTKYVKFDTYYLLKSNKIGGSKWICANVLGFKLKIAF
jgi:hypothetical protein